MIDWAFLSSSLSQQLPPHWMELFQQTEEPSFRGQQILDWFYKKYISDPTQMTNLPKTIREHLGQTLIFSRIVENLKAKDGTEKLLIAFPDGSAVECVLIRQGDRKTACISTQVGCPVGCVFCASGIGGVKRNLTTGEIVEQIFHLSHLGGQLDNIVVMGMGEPFLNYTNLIQALRIFNHPQGFNLGARRITVSTSGILEGIRRFKKEPEQFNLAISLHSADPDLRKKLIPHSRVSIEELLLEGALFQKETGRRLTLEYVLLAGVNDSEVLAHLLAQKIRGRKFLVNLIPMNPVPELPYQASSQETTLKFQAILKRSGIQTQLRIQRGDPIAAACGQLLRSALPVQSI
ncbi:MAG: 23S rRNA (adenine(2503)-C(2))-methyltransferase RlmN [Planctomycetota bacterium]